jgi:predicted RNase H-like HicB family nuclease
LLKSEEGFAASCAGLPTCCLQSTTNEALENIQSSITVHLSVVDELTQV